MIEHDQSWHSAVLKEFMVAMHKSECPRQPVGYTIMNKLCCYEIVS